MDFVIFLFVFAKLLSKFFYFFLSLLDVKLSVFNLVVDSFLLELILFDVELEIITLYFQLFL